MTMSGSGVGGNIGGPQQYSPAEIENTAATLNLRAAVGMLPDTLQVPFSQLGGNVWKYQSDASKPALPALGLSRTAVGSEETEDQSWKPIFDDLIKRLPPSLKARFLAEAGKPFEVRNPNFMQLGNALTLLAKTMIAFEYVNRPLNPQSADFERMQQNLALPGKALRGAAGHSKSILHGATAFLNKMGPNLPDHDSLRNFAQQGEEVQKQLEELYNQLRDPEAPHPEQADIAALAAKAEMLSHDFTKIFRGKDLQILDPMLQAMAAVAQALSLSPASPSLFLGLKMATLGLFSSDSKTGIVGAEMEMIIKAITGGLGAAILNKLDPAKLRMLLMLLLGSTAGAAVLASLLAEFGIGRFPAQNEGEQKAGQVFGFTLILKLFSSTGIIKTLYQAFAQACGADGKSQEALAGIMEPISLLLMALSGVKGKPENALPILESIEEHLIKQFDNVEQILSNALAEGTLKKENIQALSIALLQSTLSLKKGQWEGFLSACAIVLEEIHSSPDLLMEDLDEVREAAKLYKRTCISDTEDQLKMITSFIRAA